jgi:hypothetical protein
MPRMPTFASDRSTFVTNERMNFDAEIMESNVEHQNVRAPRSQGSISEKALQSRLPIIPNHSAAIPDPSYSGEMPVFSSPKDLI